MLLAARLMSEDIQQNEDLISSLDLTPKETNGLMIKSVDTFFTPSTSHTICFMFSRGCFELSEKQLENILRHQTIIEGVRTWAIMPYKP